MNAAWMGVYGAVWGSFAVLVGVRLPQGESVVRPPSHCDGCGRGLRWHELIPVLSWVLAGGRCRTCRATIPVWYPAIELATAVAFAVAWQQWHWGLGFWLAAWASGVLAALSAADLRYHRLPDVLVWSGVAGVLAIRLFYRPLPWWSYLAGGLAGMGLLALLRVASRGGMGLGDVKVFGLIGLLTGLSGMVLTLILASVAGSVAGIASAATGRLRPDHRIPFGPAIALAAMGVYLYATPWIGRYWGMH